MNHHRAFNLCVFLLAAALRPTPAIRCYTCGVEVLSDGQERLTNNCTSHNGVACADNTACTYEQREIDTSGMLWIVKMCADHSTGNRSNPVCVRGNFCKFYCHYDYCNLNAQTVLLRDYPDLRNANNGGGGDAAVVIIYAGVAAAVVVTLLSNSRG